VFTHKHPRTTARATGIKRRIVAAATAITFGGAFALAGAAPAMAADPDYVSWAQGQFLSGSLLGVDLNGVVSVEPAEAWSDGTGSTMTDKDPLKVKALDAVTVGTGDSVQVSQTDGIQAGVVGQVAIATPTGNSMAAAGALLDDGGIGVGDDVAMPGGDVTIDLTQVLGSPFAATLTDLELSIKAIAAEAEAEGENASGDYTIAGATLELSSPAISELTEKVNTALDSVESQIGGLTGDNGALVASLSHALQGIDPALNLLGGNADVTASINAGDLHKLVQDLLAAQYGESGVTFNLETGVVSIDLAAAVGGNLNNLPVGTELLSSPVINDILSTVTGRVAHIADQVVDRVEAALHDATVDLSADVAVDVAQSPLVQKVCQTVKQVIQVPTQVLTTVQIQVPVVDGVIAQVVNGVPIVNGLPVTGGLIGGSLGGLLGGTGHTVTWITQNVTKTVTQLVNQTVDRVVCDNKVTALPSLKTSASVDISGTVDEFLDGADVDATARVTLLGVVDTSVDLSGAVDGIAGSLTDGLFDGDGTVSSLVAALDTGLVEPAVDGLLDGDNAVGVALTDLVSVKANVQELSDGTFTQTALRVSALGGSAAVINLAQASVGPNVTSVEDPCIGDCGVGGETITPTGGTPTTIARLGALAMTGTNILMLVAMILALLAAGAYLVRESYRRNHLVGTE
jgi:hypothetical protein